MKRKLNLLCACVLIGLVLSASTIINFAFQGIRAGFEAGVESAEKGKDFQLPNYQMVCTIPSDIFTETGSVTNLKTSSQASIKPLVSLIDLPATENPSGWSPIIDALPSFVSMIAGVYCLVLFFRLIRNINRNDIFSWKNIKLLRRMGYALILLFVCNLGIIMASNYKAAQVLELTGCDYSNLFVFSDPTFILGFVSLLVAEIFAIALKMKEEQDLTI